MNPHWNYLIAGYALSIALFVVYRGWIALRRRALEQEQASLERQGITLDEEV